MVPVQGQDRFDDVDGQLSPLRLQEVGLSGPDERCLPVRGIGEVGEIQKLRTCASQCELEPALFRSSMHGESGDRVAVAEGFDRPRKPGGENRPVTRPSPLLYCEKPIQSINCRTDEWSLKALDVAIQVVWVLEGFGKAALTQPIRALQSR